MQPQAVHARHVEGDPDGQLRDTQFELHVVGHHPHGRSSNHGPQGAVVNKRRDDSCKAYSILAAILIEVSHPDLASRPRSASRLQQRFFLALLTADLLTRQIINFHLGKIHVSVKEIIRTTLPLIDNLFVCIT